MSTETTLETPEVSPIEKLTDAYAQKATQAAEPEDEEPEGQTEPDGEPAEPSESEVELEEVEFDGIKARVPKEFKNGLLREADYTRKTQEVAKERAFIAEQRKILEVNQQIEAQIFEDRLEAKLLERQVSQYEQAIQAALQTGDAAQIAMLNANYQILKSQSDKKAAEVREKAIQQQQLLQYQAQKVQERELEEVKKYIPDFSPAKRDHFIKAAKEFGYDPSEVTGMNDARAFRVLDAAAKWMELQKQKTAVTKKANEAPKSLKATGTNTAATDSLKELRKKAQRTNRGEDWQIYLRAKNRIRTRT